MNVSRRGFIKGIVATSVAPMIIPASALGRGGAIAPSERIVMAGIGLGNRGTGDLQWGPLSEKEVQFVAICDVQKSARERIKNITDAKYGNKDCAMYRDMHEMLARPDIDCILTATSDRWHAGVSILAMRAGKDVYAEKPSCMTIAEGQAVVATAKQYGRVFQTGTQRMSEANFIVCNELLRLGRLGEVKTVYAHLAPWGNVCMNRTWAEAQPEPDKEICNWDAWLGPCPWRPFNSNYLHGGWHAQYDFYSSVIGEWGSHTFMQCQGALGLTNTSPVFYPYMKDNPTADGMAMPFANGVTMIQKQQGWRGTCGVRFVGSEGWCACADGYSRPEVSHPSLLADYNKILQDYITRTGHVVGHMRDFFRCVRTRRETVANAEAMYRSMSTVHCANIAQWLQRDLKWDPVKAEFIGDDEANRLRSRAQREKWQIC